MHSERLIKKFSQKQSKVAVIGLGYVGLPMAVTVARRGYHVIGIDVSDFCIQNVNAGKNYIGDVDDDELRDLVKKGMLSASNDYSLIKDVDIILIAVPTPLDKYHQPDMRFIKDSINSIVEHISTETLMVLESTTYPGTTEELLVPPIKSKGFIVGKDVFIAFSPERVDPGNESYKTANTPKVVGGVTEDCNLVAKAFYESILDASVFLVSSPAVAEMEKIYENTFRNINIALANEMTILCERMGISHWEVIEAAKTKPYGFMAFYPGPGVGGHCIPIDPFYLTWKAREYSYHTRLIELAGEINNEMPQFVLEKAIKVLNKDKKAISDAKILLLGAAYKKDIRDVRESPIHNLIMLLEDWDVRFDYHDPYVPKFHNELNDKIYNSVDLKNISSYDMLIILTDHTCFDYKDVVNKAKHILDTRNATKNISSENIVLL
ncbi:MAG: nucleotide sugar dehydrogenase [Candidatus Cloacimonetes bacterium]|nr:nucleotide sugar dehydrogenase [Candidatus Cloacimonadota bacterium]MDD4156018.1 nucleotide sugar dehydrogenase [Candidatus Cloacimonadota bacterium]